MPLAPEDVRRVVFEFPNKTSWIPGRPGIFVCVPATGVTEPEEAPLPVRLVMKARDNVLSFLRVVQDAGTQLEYGNVSSASRDLEPGLCPIVGREFTRRKLLE